MNERKRPDERHGPPPGRRSRHWVQLLTVLAVVGAGMGVSGCAMVDDGPPPDSRARIEEAITTRVDEFEGVVGVYLYHFQTEEEIAIRADELFPTASLVKIPILCALYQRVQDGLLDLSDEQVFTRDRAYPGEDILAAVRNGTRVSLEKLAFLMVSLSDNTASLWCQELAGGGAAVNRWLAEHEFAKTRVNSRTPGRESSYRDFGWGQTTPRELANLVSAIVERRAVSPAADDAMHRMLSKAYWDGEALSSLPPNIAVLSKQGAISRSRSEVLFVHAPSGDYVLCVITRDQADTSWSDDNEGFVLLRDVSRIVWQAFEPEYPWAPAVSSERFR